MDGCALAGPSGANMLKSALAFTAGALIQNGRVRMNLRAGPGAAAERAAVVLDAARRAGPVSHFAFDRRSLAEVFLALVGRPADQDTAEVTTAEEVVDVRS